MLLGFLRLRPRRLRGTRALRAMVAETALRPAELVLPVFVKEGLADPQPISSMPGRGPAHPGVAAEGGRRAVEAGVGGIMVFGVPADKDGIGSGADDPDGISQLAIADIRAEVGDDLVIMADLCLCEYTDHGHCGIVTADGYVDNDATLERLRVHGGRPGPGGRAHGRAQRHDGRPGRRDQEGARRRGLRRHCRSAPTRPSTPRPSTARSARRPRARRSSATAPPTSRTRPTCSRRSRRSGSTWPRAPTW